MNYFQHEYEIPEWVSVQWLHVNYFQLLTNPLPSIHLIGIGAIVGTTSNAILVKHLD